MHCDHWDAWSQDEAENTHNSTCGDRSVHDHGIPNVLLYKREKRQMSRGLFRHITYSPFPFKSIIINTTNKAVIQFVTFDFILLVKDRKIHSCCRLLKRFTLSLLSSENRSTMMATTILSPRVVMIMKKAKSNIVFTAYIVKDGSV